MIEEPPRRLKSDSTPNHWSQNDRQAFPSGNGNPLAMRRKQLAHSARLSSLDSSTNSTSGKPSSSESDSSHGARRSGFFFSGGINPVH